MSLKPHSSWCKEQTPLKLPVPKCLTPPACNAEKEGILKVAIHTSTRAKRFQDDNLGPHSPDISKFPSFWSSFPSRPRGKTTSLSNLLCCLWITWSDAMSHTKVAWVDAIRQGSDGKLNPSLYYPFYSSIKSSSNISCWYTLSGYVVYKLLLTNNRKPVVSMH